jgi:hypothetical protein
MIDYLANQTMNRNPRPEIGGFLFAPIIHLLFLFSFIENTFFPEVFPKIIGLLAQNYLSS